MLDIAPGPPQSPQEQDKKTTGLGAILRRLTEPAASIREPERRRRTRLLSALLATLSLLSFLATVLTVSIGSHPSGFYVSAGTTLILAITYYVSRTGYYNLAAWLTVGALAGSVFAIQPFNSNPSPLYFLVLSVLVSSLFLSRRDTSLITAAIILGIGLLWAFLPALPATDVISAMFALFCVGALGIVGITIRQQDLEEIQNQSISLRQSEDRFQMVSFATNDVVWDWDLLTDKVWRNQGLQRLFGFSQDQIIPGMSWWEAQIHPDEKEKVVTSIHASIDDGANFWSKEYRFRRADESYVYVFDRAYIIHDEKSEKPIRMIGAIMDITARKQAEEVLRQEAVHDPLTGLFNRRYMEEMLEREFSRAGRTQQQIGIIMLDIDHFKQINDTLGHAAGDALLRALGVFLLKHVRGMDIACRYGGDEFILIFPGASLLVAQQRAEKIREGARDLMIGPRSDLMRNFTLSLGVAVFPDHGSNREAIFAATDAALYAAKEAGRNQTAVARK